MKYNSKHWSWIGDFCYKHHGFKLPCKWCIATSDPDLTFDAPTEVPEPEPVQDWGLHPGYDDEYEVWL